MKIRKKMQCLQGLPHLEMLKISRYNENRIDLIKEVRKEVIVLKALEKNYQ